MGADRFHPCNHLPQRSWGSCPAVQGSACGVVTAPGEGSRVATARENARRRAEKGVSGRAAKEGLRSAGPSEGAWHRKAAMRSERCAAASGLHLVAACDAHNRQLVSQRQSGEGRAASGWAQRRCRAAEGGDEVGAVCRCIRTSLGCCMRCAQSAAGESPPNPKVQHIHYDTGPRGTGNRRTCGCCGAPARNARCFRLREISHTQDALKTARPGP